MKKGKGATYVLELEKDQSVVDLDVIQAWNAHSPLFDFMLGKKAYVQGELRPSYVAADELSTHTRFRLRDVSLLSEAAAQGLEIEQRPAVRAFHELNQAVSQMRSLEGTLIRGTDAQGFAVYALECADRSIVHLSFVVEAKEEVDAAVGKEIRAYGRVMSRVDAVPAHFMFKGTRLSPTIPLTFILGGGSRLFDTLSK
ncbi:MAG: hypothetical protein AAFS10_15100 [Myxococcota bacterium]